MRNFPLNPGVLAAGGAYAAGDCLGTVKKITSGGIQNPFMLVHAVTVKDADNQKKDFDIVFFNAEPTAGTYTDNAAASIPAADLAKVIGVIKVVAADYTTYGSVAIGDKRVGRPIFGATHYLCVAQGTPTHTDAGLKIDLCAFEHVEG